ncbi:MAG TPA: hypothetical protein VLH15_06305 [Dehalococcoidales bacterium]|nr:hypothetical protein [Dehalococcoidales bacterium]
MKFFKNKIIAGITARELTHYPELFHKNSYSTDISYSIARSQAVILDDAPPRMHAINWKLI